MTIKLKFDLIGPTFKYFSIAKNGTGGWKRSLTKKGTRGMEPFFIAKNGTEREDRYSTQNGMESRSEL